MKTRLFKALGIFLVIVSILMVIVIAYKEIEYKNGIEFYRSLRSGGAR